MIFYIKEKKLFLCPLDVLFATTFLYCIYGMMWLSEKYLFFIEPLIILFSVSSFWIYNKFFSKSKESANVSLEITLSRNNFITIYSLACVGVLSFFLIYAYYGFEYFSLTKDLRYKFIKATEVPRILSFVTMIGLFIASVSNQQQFSGLRKILVILFWLISFAEINREMMLIMGMVSAGSYFTKIKHNNDNTKFLPLGVMILGGLVLIITKPLLFFLQFGIFPDSFFNSSELTNWIRHFSYVKRFDIDLTFVQRNDLQYFLNAIIFPYSMFDSASKVYFEDVLRGTYAGMTYGYSGLLWTEYYFKGYFLAIPWIFLSMIYSKTFFKENDFLRIIISLIFIVIVYRFFRSEWPLVVKTALWVYLYPTLILYFLLKRNN